MSNDMTVGKPTKLILYFSIPLLIGNIFQQFYSMADTIIVGKTIGVHALAAVGATGAISFLILGFVQGLTSGFSVITAQRFGAGDTEGVRNSVATSITLSVAFTIVVTAVSMFATRPLLEFMKTPSDIIDDAFAYIIIIFAGTVASVFYNLISSIIRALGDSRTPLIFLVIASIINIILDLLFIMTFDMGVAGAAYATVIAQVVSGLLCLLYVIRKYPILRLEKKNWTFHWGFAWKHLQVGLPMAFQFSITAIGVMVLQGALNTFGSTAVAAYTAASKIEMLATSPLGSLGVTSATYAAQNFGAKRMDRVREGANKCALISIIFGVVGGAIVIIFGSLLTQLFIDSSEIAVIAQAKTYLYIAGSFFPILGLLFVYRNILQGIGNGLVPLLAGVAELIMRVVVAFTLSQWIGYIGVCFANPAAWIGAAVPLAICYFITIRKLVPKKHHNKKIETKV